MYKQVLAASSPEQLHTKHLYLKGYMGLTKAIYITKGTLWSLESLCTAQERTHSCKQDSKRERERERERERSCKTGGQVVTVHSLFPKSVNPPPPRLILHYTVQTIMERKHGHMGLANITSSTSRYTQGFMEVSCMHHLLFASKCAAQNNYIPNTYTSKEKMAGLH